MEEKNKNLVKRAPVVVVLGHVDHGKSSLLEAIKEDLVITKKESGGITQHVGAYEIEKNGNKITFIDTPGHEAFSAMRSRGAKVADIALLVIDATEGVKEQTKEAINYIKKSQIPMIVVLNKMDKPGANPEIVKNQLSKFGVLVESLGGKVPCVETSAKTKKGINELIEMINLLAELENLKADINAPPSGVVIESYLDNKRGPIATLLVKQGILKKSDIIATESAIAKIRNLFDFQGKEISSASCSQPCLVLGFNKVPKVGEKFKKFETLVEKFFVIF